MSKKTKQKKGIPGYPRVLKTQFRVAQRVPGKITTGKLPRVIFCNLHDLRGKELAKQIQGA